MLDEYSITIFYLVGQAQKIEATERLDDIMVNSIQNSNEEDASKIVNYYQIRSSDGGVIDLDRDENAGEKLKGIFGDNK